MIHSCKYNCLCTSCKGCKDDCTLRRGCVTVVDKCSDYRNRNENKNYKVLSGTKEKE